MSAAAAAAAAAVSTTTSLNNNNNVVRTVETCSEPLLQEVDFGPVAEGQPSKNFRGAMTAAYAAWAVGDLDARMAGGGETGYEVFARVEAALETLIHAAAHSESRCVAAVSHSIFLRMLLAALSETPLATAAFTMEQTNCCINVIDFKLVQQQQQQQVVVPSTKSNNSNHLHQEQSKRRKLAFAFTPFMRRNQDRPATALYPATRVLSKKSALFWGVGENFSQGATPASSPEFSFTIPEGTILRINEKRHLENIIIES